MKQLRFILIAVFLTGVLAGCVAAPSQASETSTPASMEAALPPTTEATLPPTTEAPTTAPTEPETFWTKHNLTLWEEVNPRGYDSYRQVEYNNTTEDITAYCVEIDKENTNIALCPVVVQSKENEDSVYSDLANVAFDLSIMTYQVKDLMNQKFLMSELLYPFYDKADRPEGSKEVWLSAFEDYKLIELHIQSDIFMSDVIKTAVKPDTPFTWYSGVVRPMILDIQEEQIYAPPLNSENTITIPSENGSRNMYALPSSQYEYTESKDLDFSYAIYLLVPEEKEIAFVFEEPLKAASIEDALGGIKQASSEDLASYGFDEYLLEAQEEDILHFVTPDYGK